ncbi:MAG: hypothetical protein ACYDG3_13500 [Bacillati bacterium]
MHGKVDIGLAVGAARNTYRFVFERKAEQIAAEATLDGIYILPLWNASPGVCATGS